MTYQINKQSQGYKLIGFLSYLRLETTYLIRIKKVPVILVGNKLDKKEPEMSNHDSDYINVRNIIKGLVKKYRQVQMGF